MNSQKSKIVREFVVDARKILKDNLVKEYLFGSFARNEDNDISDIDILLIVKNFNIKLRGEISSLSSNYSLEKGVVISPIIKDIPVWEKNKKYNTLFYSEISKNGIEI
ncbi:MAG: nucleotidyltransferase domain-containing protein [Candidatus Marinimicrobia bacterium]|nr:nucleotidyltransferase domain-containing protein [Candidatus Neomarinimicrobiota bacterium]